MGSKNVQEEASMWKQHVTLVALLHGSSFGGEEWRV